MKKSGDDCSSHGWASRQSTTPHEDLSSQLNQFLCVICRNRWWKVVWALRANSERKRATRCYASSNNLASFARSSSFQLEALEHLELFFFFLGGGGGARRKVQSVTKLPALKPPVDCRPTPDGPMAPWLPAPGDPLLFTSDEANAFAAAHTRRQLHLLHQLLEHCL